MKRILLSVALVGAVTSAAVFATGAFFSDTETSEGNRFVSGAIDLLVDSEAHYAGMRCDDNQWVEEDQGTSTRPELLGQECFGTWEETDLGLTHRFFDYFDLKPGDHGENTISLHVDNNDAYMCAIIDNMEDNDLGLTEPEQEDGDDSDGPGNGELSEEIRFFAWRDDGDNIWEDGELVLFSNTEGPASDVIDGVVYPMFTPETEVLPGDITQYIGLYWCYGAITVDEVNNTLSCDGGPVNNVSQTDELLADISFYVEQARNNEEFTCPALPEASPEPTPPTTPEPEAQG